MNKISGPGKGNVSLHEWKIERERERGRVIVALWRAPGCVREILELAEEVISVDHHTQGEERKIEMQTERRRRERRTSSHSHHICSCYVASAALRSI